MKMNKAAVAVLCLGMVAGPSFLAFAHCQIPCGIYGDATRFTMLDEHITTIEKSMKQIHQLAKEAEADVKPLAANQLVRWTVNKDNHADAFAEIITQYFLQQRIKPVDSDNGPERDAYVHKVTLCHRMLVTAMKTKQTVDLQHVEDLKSLLAEFRKAYFTEGDKQHLGEHYSEGSTGR